MKYKEITVDGIPINVGRSRTSRSFRLAVHSDGKAYATYPWYSSKYELISFIEERIDWLLKTQQKILQKMSSQVVRLSSKELKDLLNIYIDKYIKIFNEDGYNISVDKVSLSKMKTMLGNCTPSTRSLRFSIELCKCTDRYIEYVVVHELSHLIECNHSKRFWDIVKRYIPDYKKIEKYGS